MLRRQCLCLLRQRLSSFGENGEIRENRASNLGGNRVVHRKRVSQNRKFSTVRTPIEESSVDLFASIIPSVYEKQLNSSEETPHQHVLISHGLFGASTNWKGIARLITQKCNVTAHMLDMRNHGSSPHTQKMNYDLMVQDIKHYIDKYNLERVSLIAHSMGGRVAMQMALEHPELIDKLVVVDVTPLSHLPVEKFVSYIDSMKRIDLANIQTRKEADDTLRNSIPQYALRRYLLSNLVRVTSTDETGENAFKWRINFDTIEKSLPQLMNFTVKRPRAQFLGETLFLGGSLSDYIKEEYRPAIQSLFPNSEVHLIEGAGHWVHVDQPEAFVSIVTKFLNAKNQPPSRSSGTSLLPPHQLSLTLDGVDSANRFMALERLD